MKTGFDKLNLAWASLGSQVQKQDINVLDFCNEATVFQVRRNQGGFEIRPMFVADLVRTRCVKPTGSSLCTYEDPWLNRTVVKLGDSQDVSRDNHSPAEFAAKKVGEVQQQIKDEAALITSKDNAADRSGEIRRFRDSLLPQISDSVSPARLVLLRKKPYRRSLACYCRNGPSTITAG